MGGRSYTPRFAKVALREGSRSRVVRALAFVADLSHPQYARGLEPRAIAALVAQGIGERGTCVEYLHNTLAHMRALGLQDQRLDFVLGAARSLRKHTGTI